VSEVRLTLEWLANATRGRIVAGSAGLELGEVVTDTRSLRPGDFFVALRGPRFDAHAFVGDAIAKGAVGAMVRTGSAMSIDNREGVGIVEVGDTLQALQELGRAIRLAAGTKVVAITGSAGKTTTKETIAAFLATRFRVVKNKGNLNNHIGLPLSLVQLRSGPDVAVMELGMNHAGEISVLVGIAKPDVRVWTNVGDAHLGFFASPDAIADAKAEILEGADRESVLVYNADDPLITARVGEFAGRTITFGTSAGADVQATDVQDGGVSGMRARVRTLAGERAIETPLLGRGNLSNVLAGIAVALDAGIPLDDIVQVAAELQPADRRGAVRRLGRGVTLVDDSYNSSPAALRAALDVIAKDTSASRKVAVLGEMLELGDRATGLHEACGRAAVGAGVQRLFVVGGAPARALAAAAIAAGLPDSGVTWFDTSDEAAPVVAADVRPGDLILVKGSRGTRTDVVADRIAKEFA
jgi:UDP-N-acetylmuramoyl-tripeptide--D-alanyl-D-alanine ligase